MPRQAQPREGAEALLRLAAVLLLPALLLGGCVGSPGEGAAEFFDNATGRAIERRGLPPGSDRPFRNLSEVPPRPSRPDDATRAALTRRLEQERAGASAPLQASAGLLPPPPQGASTQVPLAPPAPAALRAVPAVARSSPPEARSSPPEARSSPPGAAAPARLLPVDPGSVPPPPPRPLPADPGLPPPPPSIR